jgi:hypothetical protein
VTIPARAIHVPFISHERTNITKTRIIVHLTFFDGLIHFLNFDGLGIPAGMLRGLRLLRGFVAKFTSSLGSITAAVRRLVFLKIKK